MAAVTVNPKATLTLKGPDGVLSRNSVMAIWLVGDFAPDGLEALLQVPHCFAGVSWPQR